MHGNPLAMSTSTSMRIASTPITAPLMILASIRTSGMSAENRNGVGAPEGLNESGNPPAPRGIAYWQGVGTKWVDLTNKSAIRAAKSGTGSARLNRGHYSQQENQDDETVQSEPVGPGRSICFAGLQRERRARAGADSVTDGGGSREARTRAGDAGYRHCGAPVRCVPRGR